MNERDVLARLAALEQRVAFLESSTAMLPAPTQPVWNNDPQFYRPVGNPFTVPPENQA